LDLIVNKTYDEKTLILIILKDFCRLSGINLEVNRCVRCGNNKIKTISLKDHGMLCNMCFDRQKDKLFDLETSKAIHYLFNGKYEELNKYYAELDFVIKLLKTFILDNIGISFVSIKQY
jgi:recombinational DNA repair protein (RecF pathway)